MMMRFALILATSALAAGGAFAQSSPNFSRGQVPTAGQWNAAFATKQDRLTFTPLNQAGGTMAGKLQAAPATVNGAGFSLLPGITPTSPSNGDLWVSGGSLFARLGGLTQQFLGSGGTGDVSGMSVKAPGAPTGQSLATWLATPYFAASSSPNGTDAYASGFSSGRSAVAVVNSDGSAATGQERYGAFFSYNGPGTGDPAVINTSFGVGAAAIKQNWFNSTVPGQMVGANITVRNGYFGADANAPLAQYGGYNPAGDATGVIVNSVQASPYGQNAATEFSIHYAKNGRFDSSSNVHSINAQIAPMRMLNPDGSVANPGIGLSLTAAAGQLSYALQAVNTARAGSYSTAPGYWGGFARYNYDDGTRAPFDAFRVDQDGSIFLSSGNATTPSKKLRVSSGGSFEVANDAGTTVASLSDGGVLTLGVGAAAKTALTTPGSWPGFNPAITFDSGTATGSAVSAEYEVTGKTLRMFVRFTVSLAAGGTAGNAVYVALPAGLTINDGCTAIGRNNSNGGSVLAFGSYSDPKLTVLTLNNGSVIPAAGSSAQVMFSATCQVN
jgi:hypothetical protein